MSDQIDIELLKKDVNILTSLCEKLDISIDKMQEIASNLSRLVSLQQQRLEIQEKTTKEIESVLEMRRVEHNNDIKELHSRITNVNRELTEKIDKTENKILSEIKALREELSKDENSISRRLFDIESWKWMVMGGLFVLGWIASKIIPHIQLF
jgi:DNA repair exonuclease SbcCD ATPase subunit